MAAKGKRPMRALTAGDKIEAIQRVNDGESKASVARDIGVPESTLRGWCKNEDKLRYMSTRHSTPETDKSSDAEQPPEKRTRYDLSPSHTGVTAATTETLPTPVEYLATSSEIGLDLSSAPDQVAATPAHPEPIELTKPKTESRHEPAPPAPQPQRHAVDLKTKPDPASVSMSAISPLTGLNSLPGVQNSLGLSFNDIANNLSLIAQLNPSLSALTSTLAAANTNAKTLRSIRSPKPSSASHATPNTSTASLPLNLSDKYKSSKHEYSERRSKSHYKDPPAAAAPVDEALWYWLKTQQAMLDLTATAGRPAHHERRASPKPIAPAQPLASTAASLDLNKNTWFWQYYKQFGGAMPFPSDKALGTMTAPAPREKNENILYSHLTKGKSPDIVHGSVQAETKTTPPVVSPAAASPPAVLPERDTLQEKPESIKSQSKARTVLDNLLFNNNNVSGWEGGDECCNAENEFDGVSEALEHGGKFLAWLEACRDPSVTRMHVHSLRALLSNIRARAARKPAPPLAHDRVSRRK